MILPKAVMVLESEQLQAREQFIDNATEMDRSVVRATHEASFAALNFRVSDLPSI